MAEYLDIESWNRKNLFYFFKNYDHPFFNICANLDITKLLAQTRAQKRSFFIASLYMSLKAANAVPEFRYRIEEEKVVVHEKIHAGSTVLNKDETFSFCYFDYYQTFAEFEIHAKEVLRVIEEGKGTLNPRDEQNDMIHYSVIPWVSFTSFSHARKFKQKDSVPKIVFGKYFQENQVYKMPVSVEVHHALMDGLHVGKFFDLFQSLSDNFSSDVDN